jgi:fimbrial isopeptide formation D2 family protein
LPECCFEYANNVLIKIAGEEINENDAAYPNITVTEDILFDWRNVEFFLENGESVIIEFDAKVINYCEDTVTNWACAFLWGCYICDTENYVFDCDTATVQCYPHDPIFEKTVLNGEQWDEKANVYVDDTVRFKIELTYYGNENLTDIKIVDELPCVLIYAGNEKVKIIHSADQAIENLDINSTVSEDKKTVWWNLTNELSDRDTLSIEFDALVTGITGDCGDCGINTASYTGYSNGNDYSGSDNAQISSTHQPPAPPVILSITINHFNFGQIYINIRNIGGTDASNVKWNITVKSGILKRIKAKASGTIAELDAGSSASISTGKRSIKHGFGRATVTITVSYGEKTLTMTFSGLVIGRLFIDRSVHALG